jgi:hypothetical protein
MSEDTLFNCTEMIFRLNEFTVSVDNERNINEIKNYELTEFVHETERTEEEWKKKVKYQRLLEAELVKNGILKADPKD